MITNMSKVAQKSLTKEANLGQIFKSVIKVTKLEGDHLGVSQLEVSQLEGAQLGVAEPARARCQEAKQMSLLIKDPRIPKIRDPVGFLL